MTCLADMASLFFSSGSRGSVEDRQDVVLGEDDVLDAVELHFGPGVLAEEDAVAVLHFGGTDLAVLEQLAVPDGDHETLDGLLLGAVRNDDAPFGLLFLRNALDHDAV